MNRSAAAPVSAVDGHELDLMGTREIAEMLGVTRQRVDVLSRGPQFPEPVARLRSGRVWLERDVEQWAAADGRIVWID